MRAPSKWETTKFHGDYIDQLIIYTMLDSTHCKLRDLENRVFVYIIHTNRVKVAFVPIPSSAVTTQGQLNKATHSIDYTDNTFNKIKYFAKVTDRELLWYKCLHILSVITITFYPIGSPILFKRINIFH